MGMLLRQVSIDCNNLKGTRTCEHTALVHAKQTAARVLVPININKYLVPGISIMYRSGKGGDEPAM